MEFNIYTDGGARGNPGVSGYGWVIYDDIGQVVHQDCKYLGIKTNNEAEYLGLIGALTWVKDNKAAYDLSQLNIYMDSQLVVRQVQGVYKVKSSGLLQLFNTVKHLLSEINTNYSFQDVRREFNTVADRLANQAMDQKR